MLIYEYKLDGTAQQYAAIDEAIRVVQFIRNKCLRLWMDGRKMNKNDLQCYCAVLAKEYSFANCLNSQARQASADRAWFAISRFYENCRNHKPGKKGYPKFQHDNRSVEVRRFGAYQITSREVGGQEQEHLLGHPTYLKGKPKGETSMLGKQLNRKVCNVTRCKSWTHGQTYTG